jgi:hypothetical protein
MTAEQGRWVGTHVASRILSVNDRTLTRWIREGLLHANGVQVMRTLGGRHKLFEPDVEALARRLTNLPGVRR